MERRDRNILISIIQREWEAGLVIHSDEWPTYENLNNLGYRYNTVNHQDNYVDPLTEAHTQGIERSWLDAKTCILKNQTEKQSLCTTRQNSNDTEHIQI